MEEKCIWYKNGVGQKIKIWKILRNVEKKINEIAID